MTSNVKKVVSFMHKLILCVSISFFITVHAKESDLNGVKSLLLHGQFTQAANKLKRLSDKDHPYAKYQLAMLYLSGKGVSQSNVKAEQLLTEAANRNSDAAYLLGSLYFKGSQFKRNLKLASYYLNLASTNDHARAKRLLKEVNTQIDKESHTHSNYSMILDKGQHSKLLKAINSEDIQTLTEFKSQGVNFNSKVDNDTPILHYSVRQNKSKVLRWLINQGVDLNQTDSNENSAIQISVLNHNLEILKLLTSHYLDINHKNKSQETALMMAIKHKFYAGINLLIDKGANIPKSYKQSVHRQKQINYQIQSLKNLQANGNSEYFGWPLIAIAVSQNQPEAAMALLKDDHNPWIVRNHSNNAINLAIIKNYSRLAKTILNQYPISEVSNQQAISSFLMASIRTENSYTLKLAIQQIHKLQNSNLLQDGLAYSIKENKPLSLELLLEESHNEATTELLIQAMKNRSPKVAMALIKAGAKIYDHSPQGSTPLIQSIQLKDLELFNLLLSKKVPVNEPDSNGLTALMWATKLDCIQCVEILLSKGATVNIKSANGNNVLMHASQGRPEILKRLLEFDFDLSERNNLSYTALMLAVLDDCLPCVNLLLKHDANPLRKTNTGKDSFDLAIHNPKILSLLESN